MGEFETENLIDFSMEKLIEINSPEENSKSLLKSSTEGLQCVAARSEKCSTTVEAALPALLVKQDSSENNPFDIVQKMASRPLDPFDIVEKEACQKARLVATPLEVKEGKLLSFSNDSISPETADYISTTANAYTPETENSNLIRNSNRIKSSNHNDNSTSPSSSTDKCTLVSDYSVYSTNSIDTTPTSSNVKRIKDNRKRLLKLSLSNSTINSPSSRQTALANISLADNISMILSEAAKLGENSLAQESPLKLVDDDLPQPEENLIENKNFDNDLEMLKIPMLEKLPSLNVQKSLFPPETKCVENKMDFKKNEPLTNLADIRNKLKIKRDSSNNCQDVNFLLESLKSLIAGINVCDENKKEEVTNLLDTLSTKLSDGTEINAVNDEDKLSCSPKRLQPFVRQRTFDIELQEKNQKNSSPDTTSQVGSNEIRNDTIKSSSTYGAEVAEDENDLIFPEIKEQPVPHQLSDIVDQLGQILEQYQLNNLSSAGTDHSGHSKSATINPTFIVVMNTPQATLTTPLLENSNQPRVSLEASHNNDSCFGFQNNNDSAMRRRSQSLSIHDKIKVVHLPIRQSVQRNTVPVVSETSPSNKCIDRSSSSVLKDEPKTPSHMIRRNSFSSGTPSTSKFVRRHSNALSSRSETQRSLETHHERQEYLKPDVAAGVGCPLQNMDMNTLKLQLTTKKRVKSDSILKSSAPMKATIPMKKVVPTIVSPVEASMELIAKTPSTATPIPLSTPHSTSAALNISSGFPNACSTPTIRISPMKRSIGTARSRYSHLTATPSVRNSGALTATNVSINSTRRRTISEFKMKSPAKSPIKSRVSYAVQNDNISSKVKSTGLTNNIDMRPSNVSKTINSMAPPSTNGRNSIRTRSTRASLTAAVAPHRKKENKLPL